MVLLLFEGKKKIFPSLAMLFFLVSLATYPWAVNKSEWLYSVSRTFLFVCSIYAIREVIKDPLPICRTMVFLGFIFLIIDLFCSKTGLMGNENPWSAAHVLILPFCFYKPTLPSKIVAVLLIIAVCLIGSRSAMLAMAVCGIIYLLSEKEYLFGGLLIVLLALIACNTDLHTLSMRFDVWRDTMKMGIVGSGNWPICFDRYTDLMIWRHPHNDFILVLSETSIIGLIVYAGMIACAIYRSRKLRSLALGLIGYSVIACFSNPHEKAFTSLILATMIAWSTNL
jgi:O-antigen ligase